MVGDIYVAGVVTDVRNVSASENEIYYTFSIPWAFNQVFMLQIKAGFSAVAFEDIV